MTGNREKVVVSSYLGRNTTLLTIVLRVNRAPSEPWMVNGSMDPEVRTCLTSSLDCLISSIDCLISGLDCLVSGRPAGAKDEAAGDRGELKPYNLTPHTLNPKL